MWFLICIAILNGLLILGIGCLELYEHFKTFLKRHQILRLPTLKKNTVEVAGS